MSWSPSCVFCFGGEFILVAFVSSVKCSERRVLFSIGDASTVVSCWDNFNSTLSIRGALPNGLLFENNTLYGRPLNGMELTVYEVVSEADMQNPFELYIGGKAHLSLFHCSVFIASCDWGEHGRLVCYEGCVL